MRESVWAVSMFRDEADIAEYTLKHLASQDIDGIIVADNLSVDGTRDILRSVKSELSIPLLIVDDPEAAYYQGRKMTALARMAHERGASWIIPFDADELWYSRKYRTVGAALRDRPEDIRAIKAKRWNHVCTALDPESKNPFARIIFRENTRVMQKAAYRYDPAWTIQQGNHGLAETDGHGVRLRHADVKIRHFPYRNFSQFVRKIRNGCEAYRLVPELDGMASHWKRLGAILDAEGEGGLRREWTQFYREALEGLRRDPAPYCKRK